MRGDRFAPERESNAALRVIVDAAVPLAGGPGDLDPALELIGDASCVLIGEASHGTHDFYRIRAELTKRLIREKGFAGVAAEADWPDADRVNRYVLGRGVDQDAVDSLADFKRFPAWMWRNADVLDFVGWLREFNEELAPSRRVGFHGLDLYSMHGSIGAVLEYLERTDPAAARRARMRYSCFEDVAEDPQRYGYVTEFGLSPGCEDEVVGQLVELLQQRDRLQRVDGQFAADEFFSAEQNARLIKNAEQYYRAMFQGRVSSWNLRDTHMAETFEALREHLSQRRGATAKLVVWAHNSHVGDARADERGEIGEVTVGQLIRTRHEGDTALLGFTTHTGTVTAANDWGDPAERKNVRPSLAGSCERLFHDTGLPKFFLRLREAGAVTELLERRRLHRAIGVIYRPQTERMSHYFESRLSRQYDAIFHLDHTRALEPLERTSEWEQGEAPETYPSGV
jgi:erythromycin esterase-like protein